MTAYKWTIGDHPIHGSGTYDLSGTWMEVTGDLVWCQNGFHASTRGWLPKRMGTDLWEVEIDGDVQERDGGELLARKERFVRRLTWDCKKMISFANACSERAKGYAAAATDRDARSADAAGYAARAARSAASDVAHVAAHAAAYAAYAAHVAWDTSRAAGDAQAAEANERRKQVEWIEEAIGEKLIHEHRR
jgi:hypothetical protein